MALLIPLIILLVTIAVILGWSLALGALLAMVLPLELFEGTLLAMVASGLAGYVMLSINRTVSDVMQEAEYEYLHEIPLTRFAGENKAITWGDMFRFEVANAIHVQFKAEELASDTLSDTQLQEIAIRMADVSVTILKRKSPTAKSLGVTAAQLKNQMTRQKLQPYDDDILQAAADGIALALTAPALREVVRDKLWDEPTPIVLPSMEE